MLLRVQGCDAHAYHARFDPVLVIAGGVVPSHLRAKRTCTRAQAIHRVVYTRTAKEPKDVKRKKKREGGRENKSVCVFLTPLQTSGTSSAWLQTHTENPLVAIHRQKNNLA